MPRLRLAAGAAALLLSTAVVAQPLSVPTGADTLTLVDARALALNAAPGLAAFVFEQAARDALVRQAARRANPTLGLDTENLFAPSDSLGGDGAQTTLALALPLDGARRAARVRLAEAERDALAPEVSAARRDIVAAVAARFAAAVAAQERARLAAETVALAADARATIATQVELGDRSPIDETRAEVALARARAEAASAEATKMAALRALATLWGGPPPVAVAGRLSMPAVPPFEALVARLDTTPEIARVAAEAARRDAAITDALAGRRLAPTVSAGLRRYHRDGGGLGAVVGVSLPLPLFDRGSDALAAAAARRGGIDAEREAVRRDLVGQLADAYGRLDAATREAAVLADAVVPGARAAANAVTEGYRLGRFSVLDVLDAERTAAEARALLADALAAAAAASANVERIVGVPLTDALDVPRLPTPDPTPNR